MEGEKNTRLDILTRDGSHSQVHMINYFTNYRNEIFQYAIIKSDAKPSSIEELTILHLHSYLGMRGYIKGIGAMSAKERMAVSEKGFENGLGAMSVKKRMAAGEKGYENGLGAMLAEERMAASEKGYENGLGAMMAEARMAASEKGYIKGIGAMSAEERMAASEKGYENGLGAMSAEARMAASEKGSSNDNMGIAWERKFDALKKCVEMPDRGTPLYTWKQNQLSNTYECCLNAKIRKEIEENEGSTVWSERRVELSDCVEQKNHAKISNSWERKFEEFKKNRGNDRERNPAIYLATESVEQWG